MIENRSSLFFHEIVENLRLSIPLLPSTILPILSTIGVVIIIAHLGQSALAASALVSVFWNASAGFFVGTLCAISILISHRYGSRDYTKISELMRHIWIATIVMSFLLMLLFSSLQYLLSYTKQTPAVITQAISYIYSLTLSVPGLLYLMLLENFLLGIGKALTILATQLIIMCLQLSIGCILAFGWFGLPKLGILGVGIGYGGGYLIAGIGLSIYLSVAKPYKEYRVFHQPFSWNSSYIRSFLRLGLPIGFSNLAEAGSICVLTTFIAQVSHTVLAAQQVALLFYGLLIIVPYAISRVVGLRIGHLLGEKSYRSIYYATIAGMIIITIVVGLTIIMTIQYHLFLDLFNLATKNKHNAKLLTEIRHFFPAVFICVIISAFRNIAKNILSAIKETTYIFISTLFSLWLIAIPAAYVLTFTYQLGGAGVWLGFSIGMGVSLLLMCLRILSKFFFARV